jgi:hypothetical protein
MLQINVGMRTTLKIRALEAEQTREGVLHMRILDELLAGGER